ncbi:hypothetical protein HELRODRAFT_173616 [Helobdella robusta]|uniref:Uncharacterized protein n=1 Tax=Helobdella robusta TaxID=6412 RepID=T1F720_HELRO|nr:hypothetical protein HELRODRAFT_173616 [Helobdella robusta]ESO03329.1 hypothetical protein HELRODRAFT_173616 [Helobdella robusta]
MTISWVRTSCGKQQAHIDFQCLKDDHDDGDDDVILNLQPNKCQNHVMNRDVIANDDGRGDGSDNRESDIIDSDCHPDLDVSLSGLKQPQQPQKRQSLSQYQPLVKDKSLANFLATSDLKNY